MTSPDALPDGWVWTTLGEAADLIGGGTPTREVPEYFTGGIVWLTPTEIPKVGVTVVRDSKERITEEALRRSSARLVPKGSVLMTSRASIGYVAVAGTDLTTNQGFASFVPRGGVFNFYLAYWLRANTELFLQHATGTTFKEITKSKLRPLAFPLAPIAEQHRIVAEIETQFSRLDAGVAALKRVQAALRRYKASVLKAACEGRLAPSEAALARVEGREFESGSALLARILAERRAQWERANPSKRYVEPKGVDAHGLAALPEGWVWATVEQLGEVRLGRQRSPRNHVGPNMRQYLRAANATWAGVDLSDVMEMNFTPAEFETYRLRTGDILLSEASGSANEVGKPFIWKEQIADCCFQNTLIRVRLDNLEPDFLFLHFRKDALTGRFATVAKGVGIHHLGAERLAVLPVMLPPLAEQHRIVAEVERRLSVAQEVEGTVAAGLRRAERLRQSILKRAFAGRLVGT